MLFFSFLKWFPYHLRGLQIERFASAQYFGAESKLSFQRGWLQQKGDDDDDSDDVNGHVLTLETKVRLKPVHCDQHSKPFVCQLSAPPLLSLLLSSLFLLLSNCCCRVIILIMVVVRTKLIFVIVPLQPNHQHSAPFVSRKTGFCWDDLANLQEKQ